MFFETKTVQLECKADTDKRLIKGYASVFGVVDSDGDLIERGAFADTIREKFTELPEGKSRIKMMDSHERFIGLPTVMREDERGLYVEGRVSKTAAGDEVLTLVADGVTDEMSIGFITRRAEDVRQDDQHGGKLKRILKALDLFEFSTLAWGANSHTSAEVVKGDWLLQALAELKEGRVLSSANESKLLQAAKLIDEVLETSARDEDDDESKTNAENEQAIIAAKSMLKTVKNIGLTFQE